MTKKFNDFKIDYSFLNSLRFKNIVNYSKLPFNFNLKHDEVLLYPAHIFGYEWNNSKRNFSIWITMGFKKNVNILVPFFNECFSRGDNFYMTRNNWKYYSFLFENSYSNTKLVINQNDYFGKFGLSDSSFDVILKYNYDHRVLKKKDLSYYVSSYNGNWHDLGNYSSHGYAMPKGPMNKNQYIIVNEYFYSLGFFINSFDTNVILNTFGFFEYYNFFDLYNKGKLKTFSFSYYNSLDVNYYNNLLNILRNCLYYNFKLSYNNFVENLSKKKISNSFDFFFFNFFSLYHTKNIYIYLLYIFYVIKIKAIYIYCLFFINFKAIKNNLIKSKKFNKFEFLNFNESRNFKDSKYLEPLDEINKNFARLSHDLNKYKEELNDIIINSYDQKKVRDHLNLYFRLREKLNNSLRLKDYNIIKFVKTKVQSNKKKSLSYLNSSVSDNKNKFIKSVFNSIHTKANHIHFYKLTYSSYWYKYSKLKDKFLTSTLVFWPSRFRSIYPRRYIKEVNDNIESFFKNLVNLISYNIKKNSFLFIDTFSFNKYVVNLFFVFYYFIKNVRLFKSSSNPLGKLYFVKKTKKYFSNKKYFLKLKKIYFIW